MSERLKPTIIAGIAYVASIAAATQPLPANARCFKYWYYPSPQHCEGQREGPPRRVALLYSRSTGGGHPHIDNVPAVVAPIHYDIPLPDLNDATWGGAMDSELELEMQRQKALRRLSE